MSREHHAGLGKVRHGANLRLEGELVEIMADPGVGLFQGSIIQRARTEAGPVARSGGAQPSSWPPARAHSSMESEDVHFLAFRADQAVLLEAGEDPRHGFHGQAEVVADLVARHGQAELLGGETAGAETRRQVDQEGSDALVGGLLRQQQHHLLVVANLPAHQTHQLATQLRQLLGEFVQALEGNLADRGWFQCLRRYRVGLGIHAGQADQFAGQVEAGDLFFAGIGDAEGFQGAGAHGKDRTERIALAEQEFAFLEGTTALDDLVQRIHVFHGQRQREAQRGQTAILAVCLGQCAHLDGFGH
ncbi:Uncharacterised protein [Pseudomonas aeruginosa]|nr:Uncharacterised protein [Pseudomonas aeruginosa]